MAEPLDPFVSQVAGSAQELIQGNVVKIGVDLVEIARIAAALRRPGFAARCFTAAEQQYCDAAVNSAERYAVRFSAKEAVLKALGVGLGGVPWHDIEVIRNKSGEPDLAVSGRGSELAPRHGN